MATRVPEEVVNEARRVVHNLPVDFQNRIENLSAVQDDDSSDNSEAEEQLGRIQSFSRGIDPEWVQEGLACEEEAAADPDQYRYELRVLAKKQLYLSPTAADQLPHEAMTNSQNKHSDLAQQGITTDHFTETETENNSHQVAHVTTNSAPNPYLSQQPPNNDNNNDDEAVNTWSLSHSTMPANQCRFCYGEELPLIQPCNCKGSMAYVHGECLGKWLETRQSLRCDICNYSIRQTLELKKVRRILQDLIKFAIKRLTREKFWIFKVVIYSAYIVLSCKKAVACYRLLVQQLRKNFNQESESHNVSQTILCILYLLLIVVQLAVVTTEEMRYFYRVLRQHLRLVCYQITFQNKADAKVMQTTKKMQQKRTSALSGKELLASKVVPPIIMRKIKKSQSKSGTQGFLERKEKGTSGLFELQMCGDEEVNRESAAAAQQIITKQFREEQLRFQKRDN